MLLTCLALECALRFIKNDFINRDLQQRLVNWDLHDSSLPAIHDPALGWIPRPGYSGADNNWKVQVTIGEDGIRGGATGPFLSLRLVKTPQLHRAKPRGIPRRLGTWGAKTPVSGWPRHSEGLAAPILAVGDSFTFGDDVPDEETWPALLEALTGARVLNAGVFGYGLDQAVLRAEGLVKKYNPAVLVVSYIPEDVHRCQLDINMGAGKPYFEITGGSGGSAPGDMGGAAPGDMAAGSLALRNVPVPERRTSATYLRRLLGGSYLVNAAMMRLNPTYWMLGTVGYHKAHSKGLEVAALLMRRLDALARERAPMRVVFLAQYTGDLHPKQHTITQYLKKYAGKVEVCDLWDALDEVKAQRPQEFARLYFVKNRSFGHMTAEGNRFVTERLGACLFK